MNSPRENDLIRLKSELNVVTRYFLFISVIRGSTLIFVMVNTRKRKKNSGRNTVFSTTVGNLIYHVNLSSTRSERVSILAFIVFRPRLFLIIRYGHNPHHHFSLVRCYFDTNAGKSVNVRIYSCSLTRRKISCAR